MTINSPVVAGLSLAGFWTASVYGFTAETVITASIFTSLGIIGRLGLELSQAGNGQRKPTSVFSLLAGSLCSCATLTVLYLALLKALGIQNDNATVFGLIFLGFIGPKALLWLLSTGSSIISKKTGLTLPSLQDDGKDPVK